MAISLKKGGRVDLGKEVPSLKNVGIGLGWDENESDTGDEYDLDASLFMINNKGKVPSEGYFVFYGSDLVLPDPTDPDDSDKNKILSPDGAVIHQGDNKTGGDEGDDESIFVELNKIDTSITELVVVVTIHAAEERHQNFGQVSNAYVRIFDLDTDKEIAKYDLEEDFSTETAIEFGRLYKKDGSWRFKAVGLGYDSGLGGFVKKFGLSVKED